MATTCLNLPGRMGSTATTAASYHVQHRPKWVQHMVNYFVSAGTADANCPQAHCNKPVSPAAMNRIM
eukprot:1157910-Pelagomonas_calceolata.AAC.4